jgi:hypothetical protein
MRKFSKMTRRITSIIMALILTATAAFAGNGDEMKTRHIQFSFITPVGTNGMASWNVINNFSVNLLAGYAGGLNGTELSGLVSVLRTDMNGAQFSGLGSITLGKARGAQFSGLFNMNFDTSAGGQFAGLMNLNTAPLKGFQAAGFMNLSEGGDMTQVSGFTNIASGTSRGAQVTGFANISSGQLKGAQVAGFLNVAGKLSGLQLAPFNYTDSLVRGIPIGVLSIVRNGYHVFEISSTETLYGVVSIKSGVRQFYNIFSTGLATRDHMILWGWGYGIGTLIPLSKKADLGVEGLCYQVNEDAWFTDRLNLLNKVSLTVAWNISEHVSVFGGPSWNVTVSDLTDAEGNVYRPAIAPWSVFDKTYENDLNVQMYPGITLGARF